MPEKEITKVTICRKEYKIASDDWQPLYIQRLAEILNKEVQLVEKETGIVDSYTLLVHTSIKMIDKLLALEESKTGSNQVIESEFDQLNSEIESLIT